MRLLSDGRIEWKAWHRLLTSGWVVFAAGPSGIDVARPDPGTLR
ncbi:MAG: hypothetical protein Q8N53_07580 [Longimicrobiales bacterium]|nr:hypothetical protein [Longimicrobiales bacterium]